MKTTALACLNNDPYLVKDEVLTPIKLDEADLKKRTITLAGYKFIDTGYALACPECGKISGISCRVDVDEQLDFFLKFGCEHYEENE